MENQAGLRASVLSCGFACRLFSSVEIFTTKMGIQYSRRWGLWGSGLGWGQRGRSMWRGQTSDDSSEFSIQNAPSVVTGLSGLATILMLFAPITSPRTLNGLT